MKRSLSVKLRKSTKNLLRQHTKRFVKVKVCFVVELEFISALLAIDIVKPGEKYREIGNVIQKHVQPHGYSVVKAYCGHGIHELFHTAPNVPHYAKNSAVGIMKQGQTFTIEPMVRKTFNATNF